MTVTNQTMLILPVIMSGGSGTRLWPLSTKRKPKQFHALVSERTMIQETALRLLDGNDLGLVLPPVVICGAAHEKHVYSQFEALNIGLSHIVIEPSARNTAAVAATAALMASKINDEALILLLPADHHIRDHASFRRAIHGARLTAQSRIVTFGIEPSRYETGYGYIEKGEILETGGFSIHRFLEKPDIQTAKIYVDGGKHLWNAGIFLFSPKVMIRELNLHAPEVLQAVEESLRTAKRDAQFTHLGGHAFAQSPSISIDYAVMEKTKASAVFPCDMGWADVGSFEELYQLSPKDNLDNVVIGPAYLHDTKGSLIHSQSLPVAIMGLEGVMVIVTDEGVLVTTRERAQEVKSIRFEELPS